MTTAYCPICDCAVEVNQWDLWTRMCPKGHLVQGFEFPESDEADEEPEESQ